MWAKIEHQRLAGRMTAKLVVTGNTIIAMETDRTESEVKDGDIEGVSVIMKSDAPLRYHPAWAVTLSTSMTADAGQGFRRQDGPATV